MNLSGINANDTVVRSTRMSLSLAQLRRYAFAALSVAASVGVLLLFEHFGFRLPTGQLMLLPVAINSWYGKRGPAILSVILSLLCMNYFFVGPRYSIFVTKSEIGYYIVFSVLAALIWHFSTVRRRLEEDVLRSRNNLKIEVEERSSLLDL